MLATNLLYFIQFATCHSLNSLIWYANFFKIRQENLEIAIGGLLAIFWQILKELAYCPPGEHVLTTGGKKFYHHTVTLIVFFLSPFLWLIFCYPPPPNIHKRNTLYLPERCINHLEYTSTYHSAVKSKEHNI